MHTYLSISLTMCSVYGFVLPVRARVGTRQTFEFQPISDDLVIVDGVSLPLVNEKPCMWLVENWFSVNVWRSYVVVVMELVFRLRPFYFNAFVSFCVCAVSSEWINSETKENKKSRSLFVALLFHLQRRNDRSSLTDLNTNTRKGLRLKTNSKSKSKTRNNGLVGLSVCLSVCLTARSIWLVYSNETYKF